MHIYIYSMFYLINSPKPNDIQCAVIWQKSIKSSHLRSCNLAFLLEKWQKIINWLSQELPAAVLIRAKHLFQLFKCKIIKIKQCLCCVPFHNALVLSCVINPVHPVLYRRALLYLFICPKSLWARRNTTVHIQWQEVNPQARKLYLVYASGEQEIIMPCLKEFSFLFNNFMMFQKSVSNRVKWSWPQFWPK